LHNAQRFVAGLFDALDVLPPVVDGHCRREHRGGVVSVELEGVSVEIEQGGRKPVTVVGHVHHLVHQPDDVLAGGHTRDWTGEDVVEHQGRHAQLGECRTQGFLHYAIDAAAREHGTAFDVHGAHGEAE
jgi:hypothetical protein